VALTVGFLPSAATAGDGDQGLSVTRYPFHGRQINMDKPVAVEGAQLPEVAMAGEKWAKRGVLDPSKYEPSPLVKTKDDLFWAAKFTGALVAPESGEYIFQIRADDYGALILGGRCLINQYGMRAGLTSRSEPIRLEAGKAYPVLIEYWNVLGPSLLEVRWKLPGAEAFTRAGRSAFRPRRPISEQTVTRVRLFPAPGGAKAMAGGRIAGSLTSPTNDFVTLATIDKAPEEGKWTTIEIAEPRPYRYVKYIAPEGTHGVIAELAFYSGETKLTGDVFGTVAPDGSTHTPGKVFDGETDTYYKGLEADLQYVGIDLGADAQVPEPKISRLKTESDAQTFVQIDVPEGALVRYTLSPDEKWRAQEEPTFLRGTLYDGPFAIDADRTVMARAFDMSRAPSAVAGKEITVRKIEMRKGLTTVHTGNSLMGGLSGFIPMIAASAGIEHEMAGFGMAGAPTDLIWKNKNRGEAARKWIAKNKPSVYVPQPFSRGPGNESYWETVWFDYVLEQNPDAKLMIYMQWPKDSRHKSDAANLIRLIDKPKTLDGKEWWVDLRDYVRPGEKVSDDKKLVSWRGESIILPEAKSWRQDVENYARGYDILYRIMDKQFADEHVSVIPVGMALAAIYDAVVAGKMPGVEPEVGHQFFFADGLHLNPTGQYISALTHFACFYAMDPAGKVSSAGSGLTPQQASEVQKLVWKAIQDYPHSPVNVD
jgi:hypothetical protein